jgi:hypothetical protein
MKQLYLYSLFTCCFSFYISAQNTSQNQKLQINKANNFIINNTVDNAKDTTKDTTYQHFYHYIFDDKKMKSFFKDAQIPASFPVYDHSKSYLENKLIAKTWGQENKKLIKKELRYKLD